jgi:hypothetical protein
VTFKVIFNFIEVTVMPSVTTNFEYREILSGESVSTNEKQEIVKQEVEQEKPKKEKDEVKK